jgi:hypothetical protein
MEKKWGYAISRLRSVHSHRINYIVPDPHKDIRSQNYTRARALTDKITIGEKTFGKEEFRKEKRLRGCNDVTEARIKQWPRLELVESSKERKKK